MTADTPDATAQDIAPCPFCGSGASMADNDDKEWYANTWWVECDSCDAHGPHQFDGDDHSMGGEATRSPDDCKADAIAAWNRRTPHAERAPATVAPKRQP